MVILGCLREVVEKKKSDSKATRKPSVDLKEKAPKRWSMEVKEIKECELCSKPFESVSSLGQHMVTSHFPREIRETYQELLNGRECLLCRKEYSKTSFVMHIGVTHNKLDEVLEKNGLRPLKAKLTPMIKKINIKKEALEASNESVLLKWKNLFHQLNHQMKRT